MKPERTKMVTHGVEAEPEVGAGEIPVIFMAILAGLLFVGFLYLDRYGGGFNNMVYGPYESYDQVDREQPKDPLARKREQGRQAYNAQCLLCHQLAGLGTPGQFPPLDGSEWVTGPVNRLVRIPHNGLTGPIKIKGEQWNATMPAFGPGLSDDDMAALLTFIRSNWSNKASEVTVEQVKKVRAEIADRAAPWTEAELLALPPE